MNAQVTCNRELTGPHGAALEKAKERALILPVRGGNTVELEMEIWAKRRY